METNEQVSAEPTADESQETTTETVSDSEVDQNTTDNVDKGDLRVPLKQTRDELRQFKERLNDPDFILEKAVELGVVTQEEQTQDVGQPQNQMSIEAVVQREIDIREAKEKYPLLKTNEALQYAVTAFMNKGMNPMKAADKVFAEFEKVREEASAKSAEAERAVIKDQERATTVMSSSDKSGEDSHIEALRKQAKSLDPRVQKKAMIELEILKNKK